MRRTEWTAKELGNNWWQPIRLHGNTFESSTSSNSISRFRPFSLWSLPILIFFPCVAIHLHNEILTRTKEETMWHDRRPIHWYSPWPNLLASDAGWPWRSLWTKLSPLAAFLSHSNFLRLKKPQKKKFKGPRMARFLRSIPNIDESCFTGWNFRQRNVHQSIESRTVCGYLLLGWWPDV